MTEKQKALDLVHKFKQVELFDSNEPTDLDCKIEDITSSSFTAKQCALIAVDEILYNFGYLTDGKQHYCAYEAIEYYQEVKQEIQNL